MAEKIAEEGLGHGKGPASLVFVEHEGMRDTSAVHHRGQRTLDFVIALYVRKTHMQSMSNLPF